LSQPGKIDILSYMRIGIPQPGSSRPFCDGPSGSNGQSNPFSDSEALAANAMCTVRQLLEEVLVSRSHPVCHRPHLRQCNTPSKPAMSLVNLLLHDGLVGPLSLTIVRANLFTGNISTTSKSTRVPSRLIWIQLKRRLKMRPLPLTS
jgi:hypothetical protein